MKAKYASIIFIILTNLYCLKAQENDVADKRMAAHHYSVVSGSTELPNSAVLTYPVNEFRVQDYNFLLKLMPCLETENQIIFPSEFKNVEVRDFPGGIKASFSHKETRITTRITPLLKGRYSESWDGAVLYEVESNNPEKDLLIYLGGGDVINLIWGFQTSVMKNDSLNPLENLEILNNTTLRYKGGKEKLNMSVKTSGEFESINPYGTGSSVRIRLSDGKGHVLTVFSDDTDQVSKLIEIDPQKEKENLDNYYKELLSSKIETPDKKMNEAFTSAIYNLEYSWLKPFGWGECLHHWLALWYMQVTAAADWIGQTDRSRSSILEHGLEQLENGAIPMFNPNHLTLGMKRRDWGGANNFWLWQIRHYVNYTGDKKFAEQVIPMVDKAIQQTLDEYDWNGNNLVAWGLQIGNQEDFVANPYDGSVPSMELYNMFLTRSELAGFTGDHATRDIWAQKAEQVKKTLYQELWLNDLGRFAYYKDPTERVLLDGQYQTYLYPIIYDIVDDYDQYSGLRHLRDRLTDKDRAIFASNNFAYHVENGTSTWGMQRGAAQQPWAAMGFAKAGMNNQTWLPLKAMANWAQDPRRPGAWPETGPEITPAYFTPPAGLYISTTIEALFGLKVNEPEKFIEVSPSFPDQWPEAKLNLPDFNVDYAREGNKVTYKLKTTKNLPLKIKWRLPVLKIDKLSLNGKKADFDILPGVGHVVLSLDAPVSEETIIEFKFTPIDTEISAPSSVAEGDQLIVKANGVSFNKIIDRSGVFDEYKTVKLDEFSGQISSGLLDEYLDYNQLGQLNFSRRTFFIDCTTREGINFIHPVDLTILPRFNASSDNDLKREEDKYILPVTIRNNTNRNMEGDAVVEVNDYTSILPVYLPARSEIETAIDFHPGTGLYSGDNVLNLKLPDEAPLEIKFANKYNETHSDFVDIELPEAAMIPDTLWSDLRIMPGFPHVFIAFTGAKMPKPMWALENMSRIEVEQIEGLSFKLPGRQFVPVSHKSGKTAFRLNLEKHKYKKIYLLVLPFVDNHDIFSEVARVSVYSGNKIMQSRTLNYPGDVDYWVPNNHPASFSSFREPRENRFEMLPILKKSDSDWEEGTPPDFPQSRWWSESYPVETESCLMNVVEISLDSPGTLDYLLFESLGALPAFGIVSVVAEIEKNTN